MTTDDPPPAPIPADRMNRLLQRRGEDERIWAGDPERRQRLLDVEIAILRRMERRRRLALWWMGPYLVAAFAIGCAIYIVAAAGLYVVAAVLAAGYVVTVGCQWIPAVLVDRADRAEHKAAGDE